jgi:outer membrane protein, multidrug efflux system
MNLFFALAVAVTTATPVLTLDDALTEARQQNLDLKAAQARLTQAQQASSRAWAGYLPSLTASGGYTRNSFEIVIPENIVLQPLNQFGGQVELRQALVAPSLWADIQAASQSERLAGLNTEAQRREILFIVAQTYYAAAAQQEVIRAQTRLLELNQAREKDTQVRLELGTVTQAALLRAHFDTTRAEQDLIRARNALASTKLALATLLQREPDFELAPPPEPQLPVLPADLAEKALEQRPEVAAARQSVDLVKTQRRGVGLRYLPALGLSAAYRAGNAQAFTGQYSMWLVSLGVSWTIWDGGLREANLRELSARVVEADALRQLAEARTREEVARSKLELENSLANRAKAEEALRTARETHRLTEANFKVGHATYLEVTDSNSALTSAEVGLVSERLQASLAALRLLKAIGSFEVGQGATFPFAEGRHSGTYTPRHCSGV